MKRIILAVATAAALGTGLGAFEAKAQYYGGYDDDRPRRLERRYEEDRYERRRDRYDDDRYDRRPRGGRICVTSRGSCYTRPQPFGTQCGCDIPGFGPKRGQIGG